MVIRYPLLMVGIEFINKTSFQHNCETTYFFFYDCGVHAFSYNCGLNSSEVIGKLNDRRDNVKLR